MAKGRLSTKKTTRRASQSQKHIAHKAQSRQRNTRATDARNDNDSPPEHESVLSLIRDIQSGRLPPQSISAESRRACVEHLTADGFSVAEIAQVMQASDRTIARDRAMLRLAHSVEASPELTRQMVGHMMREAEVAVNRLRRFARGADVEVAHKIEAEKASWVVTREMLQMLQRLGYLPSAPTVINGQMVHHDLDGAASAEELHREITRIEQICLADPAMVHDSQSLRMIKQVKSTARSLARREAEPAKSASGKNS